MPAAANGSQVLIPGRPGRGPPFIIDASYPATTHTMYRMTEPLAKASFLQSALDRLFRRSMQCGLEDVAE